MSITPATLSPVRSLIAQRLKRYGWRLDTGSALAVKTFKTAVGERDAFAYLADFGKESMQFMLQGDYQSEGRNQLGSQSVLFAKASTPEEIQTAASRFAVMADAAIANTYAMRLA